jgi:hypothetical protein
VWVYGLDAAVGEEFSELSRKLSSLMNIGNGWATIKYESENGALKLFVALAIVIG